MRWRVVTAQLSTHHQALVRARRAVDLSGSSSGGVSLVGIPVRFAWSDGGHDQPSARRWSVVAGTDALFDRHSEAGVQRHVMHDPEGEWAQPVLDCQGLDASGPWSGRPDDEGDIPGRLTRIDDCR
jgi:hypothetical protein